jgi:ATP-dependent exoDNAse (exonuclease V) alpha subunit
MAENISTTELLSKKFPFEPTQGQAELFEKLDVFLADDENYRPVFVLKGYAGTGKTSILTTLIKVLPKTGYKSVLMAPTGRAAKVMANYSGKIAQTIHKKIYKQVADTYTGDLQFVRQKNYSEFTLFVVDEASMISDERDFGSKGLLNDLIEFVFENEGNKLILIGDEAQLPPVGVTVSPALDPTYITNRYLTQVTEQILTEVTRQEAHSGILYNATRLRDTLDAEKIEIDFQTKGFPDFFRMGGDRLEDGLRYAYEKYGPENVILITRSNKNAVQYNQFIRNTINYAENELENGDKLMVVRNNYTLLEEDSKAGFIANGDFVEVVRIRKEEEMHGMRFVNVELKLVDYPDEPEFETKIILNTLSSNSPTITQEENKLLYEGVLQDYFWMKNKKDRNEAIKKDKFLNALQVKFAYALTCHKSQGGQWPVVFVDHGYLPDNQIDKDFVRWLYTAITRATKEVFLLNFSPQFFK